MMMRTKFNNMPYTKGIVIFFIDLFIFATSTVLAFSFMALIIRRTLDMFQSLTVISLSSLLISAVLIGVFALHRNVVRHFGLSGFQKILYISLIKSILLVGVVLITIGDYLVMALYFGVLDFLISFLLCGGFKLFVLSIFRYFSDSMGEVKNIFIFGTTGQNSNILVSINSDVNSRYCVRGLLTRNNSRANNIIGAHKVFDINKSDEEIVDIFRKNNVNSVLFTSKTRLDAERKEFVDFCVKNKIQILLDQGTRNVEDVNNFEVANIKPIQIEDLLEREEINIDIDKVSSEIKGKVVMVTGAAGSIGSEIANQVISFGAKKIILLDNAETPLHNINIRFKKEYPHVDIVYVLGNVCSRSRISGVIGKYKPAVVFHAAAYKHVPMVEYNPCEGVMTNVWGTVNVAQRSIEEGVKKFVMISTDKAVNPTNVMGATKRMAEMCVQRLNINSNTDFITTRFGNVLGSNGSVIPLFKQQIAVGGPVTVTHPDIIRYFMTIREACRLVLQAATMGNSGEILVFDMGEQVKIVDLARKMIQLSGYEPDVDIMIEFIGLRSGEKLYEELLSSEEATDATQHSKIRVAHTVVPDGDDFERKVKELVLCARRFDVDETVIRLKSLVPEFKSNNNPDFEKFDK